MLESCPHIRQNNTTYFKPNVLALSAIIVYFFLSFYESFINQAFFTVTKYYIIVLVALLLFFYNSIRIRYYHVCVGIWLAFKGLSVLWVWNGYNFIVNSQLLSQLSMVTLFIVMTLVDFDSASIRKLLIALELISFSQGFLSLFMAQKFVSVTQRIVMHSRNVLTIFGAQNDPNNTAAFLLVGFCIAMYYALIERKQMIFNIIVMVINAYALIQTGSRGGLVSLAGIVVLLVVLPSKHHEKTSEKVFKILALASIIIIGLFIIFRYSDPLALNRVFSSEGYESGSGRTELWSTAFEIVRLSPVFGLGWGSYYGYNGSSVPVHNTFIQNMCDTGLVGTVLLFMPVVEILRLAFKKRSSLAVAILAAGFFPSFFLDALNKRFFWNAVIMALLIARSNMTCDIKHKEQNSDDLANCKYIKNLQDDSIDEYVSSYIRKA